MRRVVRRLFLVILLAAVIALAFLFLTVPGRRLLSIINNRTTTAKYICPIFEGDESEVATCTDCMFYPVDKTHQLSATYVPKLVDTALPGGGKVVSVVQGSLAALFADARRQGLSPVVTSA